MSIPANDLLRTEIPCLLFVFRWKTFQNKQKFLTRNENRLWNLSFAAMLPYKYRHRCRFCHHSILFRTTKFHVFDLSWIKGHFKIQRSACNKRREHLQIQSTVLMTEPYSFCSDIGTDKVNQWCSLLRLWRLRINGLRITENDSHTHKCTEHM